jgi:hypothetical protein
MIVFSFADKATASAVAHLVERTARGMCERGPAIDVVDKKPILSISVN